MRKEKKNSHKISVEKLSHFRCGVCDGWWSVGDAPEKKADWYCPWCGKKKTAADGGVNFT